jgi:hypothetical protein
MKKILFFTLLCIFSSVTFVCSQSVIASGGETKNLPGGVTVQSTVGEALIVTVEGPGFSLTQGQQQPDLELLTPIPTLGEWGITILSLILLILGLVAIKERKDQSIPKSNSTFYGNA